MYGRRHLDNITDLRLDRGRIDTRGLVRAVMDAIADDRHRDVRYTFARRDDGDAFEVHVRDPPVNQVAAIALQLDSWFDLDADRDGDTLILDAAPLEAFIARNTPADDDETPAQEGGA